MADPQASAVVVEVVDEVAVSPQLDAALRRLLCECFPADAKAFSVRRAWNEVRPLYSVIGRHGDELVGQVGIVERLITCSGKPVRVGGIQSLAVAPQWRRSGTSKQLMIAAMDEARRRGIECGLLFCLPGLADFYSRLGWQMVDCAVTMRDAAGQTVPLTAKNIAMCLPLAEQSFPPGQIDLAGRDW
jgi:predicted N-acetyltransferase YhbS